MVKYGEAMITEMLASARPSRTRRTHAALIAAGLDLLVERPIEGIAIDQLVARAGVAKGSFFNHFADKAAFGQAVGAEIPAVLARLAAAHPGVVIALRIEPSRALEASFERGELDVAIIRRLAPGRSGEVLREDAFGWFAAPRLIRRPEEALPLVSLMPDCWLRQHGMAALDRAGLAWREAFIGGGMAAVQAAVAGGLGISPLAARLAPAGTVDVGREWDLPDLGSSCVVLRSQVATPGANAFVRELAAAFRAG